MPKQQDFEYVLTFLRSTFPAIEDASFTWVDVQEVLWLRLSNTDVVPTRKTSNSSNATSIEVTDGVTVVPNKVRDFFPALEFSSRYPERRVSVPVRWRADNVATLKSRFTGASTASPSEWLYGACQIRRTRDRNASANPGLMLGYEDDMRSMREYLSEGDALVFVHRSGILGYEVFGVHASSAFAPPLNSKKLFVRSINADDRRQVWTFERSRAQSPQAVEERAAGPHGLAQIQSVVTAAQAHGSSAIIALAGVPGTGKTYASERAAVRIAGDRSRVDVVQFHAAYAYEEFVEGVDLKGEPTKGVLVRLNERAKADLGNTYVLVIEEFTRADLSSVLGELLTYVEYRDRSVTLPYSGQEFRLAPNLVTMATFNPTDRSALEIDAALLRRLRVVDFVPSADLAVEILTANGLSIELARSAAEILNVNRDDPRWLFRMPFGHGIYADVFDENGLYELWDQRIKRFLHGPWEDHPYASEITAAYPWRGK